MHADASGALICEKSVAGPVAGWTCTSNSNPTGMTIQSTDRGMRRSGHYVADTQRRVMSNELCCSAKAKTMYLLNLVELCDGLQGLGELWLEAVPLGIKEDRARAVAPDRGGEGVLRQHDQGAPKADKQFLCSASTVGDFGMEGVGVKVYQPQGHFKVGLTTA